MAILVILILAILWAAVLLPPILRSRSQSGAPSGVGDFVGRLREGLGRGRAGDHGLPPLKPIMPPIGAMGSPMGRGAPVGQGPLSMPGAMTPAQRRRRDVLVGLLAAVGLTFLMAVVAKSMVFWVLHLMADGLLGGYVYLLLQFKARAQEQRTKVRPIAAGAPNVRDLSAARRAHAGFVPSHVDAPRGAAVLALRRTASY